MDILQQSLQAADILSGDDDDIFGELGLTFNNPPTETAGLGDDLATFASQGDTLYGSENKNIQQSAYTNYNETTSMSNFDTSQFLNTSAPVNEAQSTRHSSLEQQANEYGIQGRFQSVPSALNPNQSSPAAPLVQYSIQQESLVNYATQYQAVQQQAPVQGVMQSRTVTVPHSVIFHSPMYSKTTTTVAHSVAAVASCNSVYSRPPSQMLSSSLQQQPGTPSTDNNQAALLSRIRIATSNSFQSTANNVLDNSTMQSATPTAMRSSTPIQIFQQPTPSVQHNQRQLITLVQKPNNIRVNSPGNQNYVTTQYINGIAVQPQPANTLNQNNNVAVLRVAGTKQNINISDPQIVKALAANMLQKQQTSEVKTGNQPPRQQFIKLEQSNSVINVVPQRPQAQLRGTQQITLQNGQTILLNSGQQVQVRQNRTTSSVANYQQPTRNVQHSAKTNQMPIKGIQIASVNIPIASSSTYTTSVNVAPVASSVLAIPVIAQQDATQITVTSTNAETGATVAVSQFNTIAQTPNSSTVRSLLANSIMKQNNNISAVNNSSMLQTFTQPQQIMPDAQTPSVNGQVANAPQTTPIGPTLRLNLTPQQASQLTTAQLQTILKQHRATLQAKAIADAEAKVAMQTGSGQQLHGTATTPQATLVKNTQPASNSLAAILRPSVTTSVANVDNSRAAVSRPITTEQSPVQVFRVDPTLTEEQVDEVKKLLANRTIASKLNQLSREQQQLVLAFQAQIKAMSPPVQQYYLRNPQLFMQKVLQQIRAGKPFILHVKVDSQKNKVRVVTTTSNKTHHPTISLTQDQARTNRLASPTPATVASAIPAYPKSPSTPITNKHEATSPATTVTVQLPKKAVKRPAPAVPSKVSLVLEQLDCHVKMTTNPDCTHPFKSVRDAIRRLVPFHTCNIPNVNQECFEESEKIFDKIADRIVTRTRAMVNKYHLLCLRDSTRDSCSAEMVMIERMFLQKEKAKLAEDKARLKENPSLIEEYFPQRFPKEVISIDSDDEEDKSNMTDPSRSPQKCIQLDTYLKNETDSSACEQNISVESPLLNSNASRSGGSDSDCRSNSGGRLISNDSTSSPGRAKRVKVDSADTASQGSCEENLLLEAVDSILL